MKTAYIVSAVRTPIGSFGGSLQSLSATALGSVAVKAALQAATVSPREVHEVLFGNVLSAGLGQAPATQVAVGAGLGYEVPCTLINKVCASGMKAIMLAAQSIQTGENGIVVAGGMESMSNIPYYLLKARTGYRYGHGDLLDGLVHDGLTDAYNHCAMGVCADNTAKEMKLSREEQDTFALESYARAAAAWKDGKFKTEIVPVEITGRKGEKTLVQEDEEYKNVNPEKTRTLKPAFGKEGTVTAANASKLNDGAACVIVASEEKVKEYKLTPLARIVSFADASQDPMWFTTAPSLAIPKALYKANLSLSDISYYEINEAFSAVALANNALLKLDPTKVNVNGGAVALGHPLGASGARIVVTLINVLKQNKGKYGVAGICNGGGGASAMVIENL